MKNYEEMAAEAIRRRDIYLQQRCGRIKKAALILTVLLLFTVVGTASVMIGLNTKDAPKKPPKVTVALITNGEAESSDGTSNLTDTVSDPAPSESVTESDPEPTDSESETDSEPETTECEPETTEREPETTEREPETTEREPETTEREPQTTECEPHGTEKDPETSVTLGKNPIELGSLGNLIYYPETEKNNIDTSKDTPSTNENSGQGSGNTPYETAPDDYVYPEYYYELVINPRLYIEEGDDCFFVNNYKLPDKIPLYVPTAQEFDLHESIRNVAAELGEICDEEILASLTLENNSCQYQLNDEYHTLVIASRTAVYVDGTNQYHNWLSLIAENVEPAKGKYFTLDEIYDYTTSLPHFQIALSHVGIDEYSVLKSYTTSGGGKYHYDFVFIPKTDDPIEAFMYRNSKCVRISGNVGWGPEYDSVYFDIKNVPYEFGGYTEYTSYNDTYSSIATEMEKFGILEYFEANVVCFMYRNSYPLDYMSPYYKFYLKFIDDDGSLVCCELVLVKKYDMDGKTIVTRNDYIGKIDMIK